MRMARVAFPESVPSHLNPWYIGGLFHCYMLDESGLFSCLYSIFGGKAC